jgi:hypothetical protein
VALRDNLLNSSFNKTAPNLKMFYFLCRKVQNQPKCEVISEELFKHPVAVTPTSNERKSRVQKYLDALSNHTCLMLP